MNEYQACPEIERLAALADGKVSEEERDRILRHVNRCEDCYEILVDTLKFTSAAPAGAVHDVSRPLRLPDRSWSRYAGWAVAAAVLLAVLIPVSGLLPWGGETSPTSADFAEALETGRRPEALAAELIENLDSGRGFATRTDTRGTAFKLGVRWIDLEVARAAGDRIWADRILRELERVLESAPRFSAQLAAVQQARRAEPPSVQISAALSAAFGSVEPDYFHLGVWAESGRLAGAAKRASLLRAPVFQEGISLARRLDLPPAASAEVDRIVGLAAAGAGGDAKWDALEKSFSDLIQLLL